MALSKIQHVISRKKKDKLKKGTDMKEPLTQTKFMDISTVSKKILVKFRNIKLNLARKFHQIVQQLSFYTGVVFFCT
jgi:hypothetical protein